MPYLWAEEITDYQANNVFNHEFIIEVKRLNFFIGRNNAGKSRFLRGLVKSNHNLTYYEPLQITIEELINEINSQFNSGGYNNPYYKYVVSQGLSDERLEHKEFFSKLKSYLVDPEQFSKPVLARALLPY